MSFLPFPGKKDKGAGARFVRSISLSPHESYVCYNMDRILATPID